MNKNSNYTFFRYFWIILTGLGSVFGQIYYDADPNDIVSQEYVAMQNNRHITALSLRPMFNNQSDQSLTVNYSGEYYYNSGAPNLENMSNKWVGKGAGAFNSFNIAYRNKFILASVEPYYYFNQNMDYKEPARPELFSYLTDNNSHHEDSRISTAGIREFQLFIHRKGIGIGVSNANMWWGPGLHSSLIMTNNTSGFNTIQIGTVEEIRIKNWEFLARYVFSKFDDRNQYEPYFGAIIFGATYYSKPIISFGLTKAVLAGGNHPSADNVKWHEAALTVLTGNISAGDFETYDERWSNDDNLVTAYLSTFFPSSKLKLFIEVGRTDIFWDIYNLILTPDHSIATNFGFRKYNLFNIKELYFGVEYIKMLTSRYLDRLKAGTWYDRPQYEYNSFDGRHFGAHSGPDSDDLIIYGGYNKNNLSTHISLNYERHGLITPYYEESPPNTKIDRGNDLPEVKIELRIKVGYLYKGFNLNLNYEHERVNNYEFKDNKRNGNVIWLGIEKKLNLANFKLINDLL